jgi:cold shock CspA family protein
MTGTVIKIATNKSFGFIRGEDKIEYFFHRSDFNGHFADLEIDLLNGVKVTVSFNPTDNPGKGPRARVVTRLDGGIPKEDFFISD